MVKNGLNLLTFLFITKKYWVKGKAQGVYINMILPFQKSFNSTC